MPIYEYHCDACGEFSLLRPMAEASQPARCPECRKSAQKVFPRVNLRALTPNTRMAHETNERSAHAPHVCGAGCSHGHAGKGTGGRRANGSRGTRPGDRPVLQRSTKRNSRPWMLGH